MTNVLILARMVCVHSLTLTSGKPTAANLTITPPPTTATGTDVTLTIDVKPSGGGAESNYIVLRLSVVKQVSSCFISLILLAGRPTATISDTLALVGVPDVL